MVLESLLKQFPDVSPMDEDDVVILERLLEFGAGDDFVVALPPGRAIVGMIDGHRLHFGVIVRQVDDEFSDSRL